MSTKYFVGIGASLLLALGVWAKSPQQVKPASPARLDRALNQLKKQIPELQLDQPSSAVGSPESPDPVEEKLREAKLQYNLHALQHNENVYRWQLLSAKLIFITVILVVVSGVALAALQFTGIGTPKSARSGNTELVADVKGIRIKSPFIGMTILSLSMVFFYLYLKFVYPIS